MLTVYIAIGMLLIVALTGRPVKRLALLRIRHVWLLWAALADQILVISIIPDTHPAILAAAHVASYAMAATCIWLNRRIPGIWFIAAGGLSNGVTIALNGGTLPASASALAASGHGGAPGEFANSAVLPDAKLAFLGDVFATPSWVPGSNVFSVGDVLIWAGLAWLLWRTCRGDQSYVPRHSVALATEDALFISVTPVLASVAELDAAAFDRVGRESLAGAGVGAVPVGTGGVHAPSGR
jgi:hypothetical protein